MAGELAQSALGVGHRDRRKRRSSGVAAIDERADGSGTFRMVEESMAVEALAAQRDEQLAALQAARVGRDRKSTRLNSSHSQTSYAVFCLKKKNHNRGCAEDRS